jgi:mRNA-degrading endonuclease toxin of MazEF toxin-antitoxin module
LTKNTEYRKGDIVYVYIKYTEKKEDGTEGKDRTALILIGCGNDCVVCSVSKNGINRDAIKLNSSDCKEGKLSLQHDPSYALFNQINIISKETIRRKAGELGEDKLKEVIDSLKTSLDAPRASELKSMALERPKRRII